MSRTTRRMYCGKRRRRKSAFKLRLAGPENSRPMGMLAGQPGATLDPAVVRPSPTPPPYLSEGGDTGSGFSGDGTYTITKV